MSLEDINLSPDEVVGTIDWDAKEQSIGYPPFLKAGEDYSFVFQLEEGEPFFVREQDGKPIFGVAFKATATIAGADGLEHDSTLRYQRADFFQSAKMAEKHINSSLGELIRSLALTFDGPLTRATIEQALRQADGRGKFKATVGWQFYCKEDKLSIRTHAQGRKDSVPWPKEGGEFIPQVTCPSCGKKGFGRPEIVIYKLPKA